MLAEASTTEISEAKQPETFEANRRVAHQGGTVAYKARKEIETRTGKKVISSGNYLKEPQKKKLIK
jgi:hypothetical protein